MTKEKTILKRVRNRIAKPENWCQYSFANDSEGKTVELHSSAAVCWCLDGALRRECGDGWHLRDACERLLWKALRKIAPKYRFGYLSYNDSHSHAEVLALLDAAIGA